MATRPRPSFDPSTAFQAFKEDRETTTSPVYEPLLDRCPVAHLAPETVGDRATVGYWGIFGYDELVAAARDHKTFSNTTPSGPPQVIPLQVDPPEHAGMRRMLNPFFSRAAVERIEPELRAFGGEMLAELVAAGRADFAEAFAYPFPTRALCTFLGIPADNWRIHHEWVSDMERESGQGLLDPDAGLPPELIQRIVPYIKAAIDARRAAPTEDVISGVAHAEIGREPVDDMTAIALVMTMMMAGHITTTSAIGAMVTRLARDGELQARLRARPDRIPDFVDETLRVDGPQQAMPRKCVRDTEVAGETIKAGEFVVLNFGSANLDPGHWPDAARFDLDRADKRHLSFGRGVHLCIGQHLARAEMRLVAEELLARTRAFTLDGEVRRHAWPLTTVTHLPLRFTPA